MGDLMFHGVSASDLAREFGTPLYVMSEDEIVAKIKRVREAFDDKYPNCFTHFAAKSFLSRDMLRIVSREGLGLDIVSGGELWLARSCGFDPARATFHGNSKTVDEIRAGLEWGVGKFVCDSIEEIETISRLAEDTGHGPARLMLRVCPETESRTHAHMATAGIGTKFGIPAANLAEAARACMTLPGVEFEGYHFHAGSQLMDNTSHLDALDSVLQQTERVRDECGAVPSTLDFGGGFGVAYTDADSPEPLESFIEPMFFRTKKFFAHIGEGRPKLVIEPGRYIVAEAGMTLYTVGSVKPSPSGVTWVGVDGGYPDNPRPELYGAKYRAEAANRVDEPHTVRSAIVGKCCETGDVIIEDIMLPQVRRGDLIAVFTTGAYCWSMANNYNKNPFPATVMIKDGVPRLSIRRQTYEQLFQNEI